MFYSINFLIYRLFYAIEYNKGYKSAKSEILMNIKGYLPVIATWLFLAGGISSQEVQSSVINARKKAPKLEEIAAYPGVTNNPSVAMMYSSSNKIFEISGELKSGFNVLREFARDYELVAKVGECLSNSSITVKKQEDGSYTYFNKNSKTQLNFRPLYDEVGEEHFIGLYHFKGKKYFFDFEALGYLESRKKENHGIDFQFQVLLNQHSYLVNRMLVFLAGLAKTESLETVAKLDQVYSSLLRDSEKNLARIREHIKSGKNPQFTEEEFKRLKDFFEKAEK